MLPHVHTKSDVSIFLRMMFLEKMFFFRCLLALFGVAHATYPGPIQSCPGRVDSRGLRVPSSAGGCRNPQSDACGRVGRGIRHFSCQLLNVDPMHVKGTWARNSILQGACGCRDVLQWWRDHILEYPCS